MDPFQSLKFGTYYSNFDVRLRMGLGNRKGTMRYKIIFLALFFSVNTLCSQELKFENLPFKKNIKENILNNEIFSESKVKSFNSGQNQALNYQIAGLHPKNCTYVLKTLSLYENYSQFISFVKESHYDEPKQELNFLLSHFLLPYDMQLIFKLPRIKSTGVYPFIFEIGMLKNLNGKIYVSEHAGRCLFYTLAEWHGPHTGFPNMIFELFSQVLSKKSMEILFRMSSSLKH
jgi:hypothetical protein